MVSIFSEGWFNLLLSTAIGVIGIALAIIFYRRSKQLSRLRYLLGDAPLIGPTPTPLSEGLEIRYAGQAVPRVTSTSCGIWNAGTTTVYGRDIVAADPLRLESVEGQILRATIEKATRSVIAAEIGEIRPNQALIDFDYLDPGDGFRVQVLHSGGPGAISGKGTIRGLPQGLEPLRVGRTWRWRVIMGGSYIGVVVLASTLQDLILRDATIFSARWQTMAAVLVALSMLGLLILAFRAQERLSGRPNFKGVPGAITDDPTLTGRPAPPPSHNLTTAA